MSESQDRSEQASPYKLDEARKKGQVARSPELLSFLMMLTFLAGFAGSAGEAALVTAEHAHWWLGHADQLAGRWGYLRAQGSQSVIELASTLLPLFAALFIVTILASLLISGPVFSADPLTPDFKRLGPVAGLKRMLSRRMLVDLIKLLIKGLCFAMVLQFLFRSLMPILLSTATASPLSWPAIGQQLLMQTGYALLAVMAMAAAFDLWYSRKEFARQMRMSRCEVKDEFKRREGDPEVRAKRKGAQRALLKKVAALGKVGDADVIITNPTHYAVALRYRPGTMPAPVVLAMGRGLLAQHIMTCARQQGVPVLRRPPLARLLHAMGEINEVIPDVAQTDVARVYRWIIAMPGNKVLTP